MATSELLGAVQACMIYLIMCIIDQTPESEETSLGLLMAIKDLYIYFKMVCGECLGQSELSLPSSTWEDWIFAESQRRYVSSSMSIKDLDILLIEIIQTYQSVVPYWLRYMY
jgi:hypothetical protein